jgi:hypothetical protein
MPPPKYRKAGQPSGHTAGGYKTPAYLYNMKILLRWVLLVAFAGSLSGCALFKKKCDCPSFGHSRVQGPRV